VLEMDMITNCWPIVYTVEHRKYLDHQL